MSRVMGINMDKNDVYKYGKMKYNSQKNVGLEIVQLSKKVYINMATNDVYNSIWLERCV